MPNPPICVSFVNKLSSEEVEQLKQLGASVVAQNKGDWYSFSDRNVTKELLLRLYKHSKKVKTTNPTPVGAVNLSALQEYYRVCGILTWFLKTHVYAAFNGPVAEDADEGGKFDTIEGFVNAKRKGVFGDRVAKKPREEEDEDDEDMEIDDAGELDMNLDEYTFGSAEEQIPKAKPSTIPEQQWGDANSAPTCPGLAFPFFDDILEKDMNFCASVIRDYFLLCLGDTRDEVLAGYKAVKGALGSIAMTKAGKVLQHLMAGVKFAIEGQARLYPLFSGLRYIGFTLHGWYFTIAIDGYKHRPKVYEELQLEIRSMDEHNVAIAEIMLKLGKLKLTETRKVPTKKKLTDSLEGCRQNPRLLAELIREFEMDEGSAEDIEKLGNKLSFPQRFQEFSVENVLRAVDLLLEKSFPHQNMPMYPRGGTLTTRDPIISIFAMFGHEGFSFRSPGGKAYTIPETRQSDVLFKPYKGQGGKEVKPNPTIVLNKRSLGVCVEDWVDFMKDRRFLLKATRDSAFRCIVFGGQKGRDFWFGLVDRVGPVERPMGISVNAEGVDLGEDAFSDVEETINDFL